MPTATADRAPSAQPTDAERPSTDGRVAVWERPVSSSSFVAFRVAFGLLVAISHIRFVARGWVEEFYLAPDHHLTYPGLTWVRPLPPIAMYAVVGGLTALGIVIAMGRHTRLAAALFVVGFAYCEAIDAALYLNHYWFITLAGVVLAIVPGPHGGRIPVVSVWALRAQLGAVYVFAGIAKLNSDWLVRAQPLATWLAARTDRPVIGPLLDHPVAAFAFSWVGAAFDLTIVGWLLWHRSRPLAYAVLVVFHVATAMLFQIGMFPWVMIALTPIFFPADWADRPLAALGRTRRGPRVTPSLRGVPRVCVVALVALAAMNVVLPLRHLAADGNVRWNDDGSLLAWRVMLTERAASVVFHVSDPSTGATFDVDPSTVLDEWQMSAALVRADLILTTAHLVADEQRRALGGDVEGGDVEVRADVFVAWNGRLRERWIDPTVDLAALSRSAPAAAYVLSAP